MPEGLKEKSFCVFVCFFKKVILIKFTEQELNRLSVLAQQFVQIKKKRKKDRNNHLQVTS